MALSTCTVQTDRHGRETASHGGAAFPAACYDEDLAAQRVPWHWHDEFEFLLMTQGSARIRVEGAALTLGAGEAVLISSGALHSADGEGERALCRSVVFHPRLLGGVDSVFWQRLAAPLLEDKTFRYQRLTRDGGWQEAFIDHMTQAWHAVAEETADYENEARYRISKAFRLLADSRAVSAAPAVGREGLAAERTKVMMGYIHAHYAEELTLEDVAASASVSKSLCLRSFRSTIGLTPMRYAVRYRLERAAELLTDTDLQAGQIAAACGFSDISYFTRAFREEQGCAPLAYRRAHRSGGAASKMESDA
jgi:AraC-like DNA-binding protein/mannose-6-phosphate isomerase-like protein (cupin superfamily)